MAVHKAVGVSDQNHNVRASRMYRRDSFTKYSCLPYIGLVSDLFLHPKFRLEQIYLISSQSISESLLFIRIYELAHLHQVQDSRYSLLIPCATDPNQPAQTDVRHPRGFICYPFHPWIFFFIIQDLLTAQVPEVADCC